MNAVEALVVLGIAGVIAGVTVTTIVDDRAREKAVLAATTPLNAKLAASAKDLKQCEVKRDYAENEMKYMDPNCAGFACQGLFTSETAGIIAAVQIDYEISIYDWQHFCMTDVRVDMWKNYAGATLTEFGLVPTAVPGQYIMHCGWLVPSKVWCKK